jgi:ABC-type multidrug transport system fused ATPase/permease subunit
MVIIGGAQNIVIQKLTKKNEEAYLKGGADAEQSLSSIKIVKAYNQEALELDKFRTHLGAKDEEMLKGSYVYGLTQGLIAAIFQICRAYSFIVATALVLNNVSFYMLIYNRLITTTQVNHEAIIYISL